MEDVPSRVLVVSTSSSDINRFASALLKQCKQQATESPVQNLHLDNKYYSADLELHSCVLDNDGPTAPLSHETSSFEAIVWIVDLDEDASMLLSRPFIQQSVDEHTFDVSLLITLHASNSSKKQELCEWGQEHLFEYIELDPDSNLHDFELHHQGNYQEKTGMERVVEVLESNMWSSMCMKKMSDSTDSPAEKDTSEKPATTVEKGEDDKLNKALKSLDMLDVSDSAHQTSQGSSDALLSSSELGDDGDLAEFSSLLAQAQNIRDQGHLMSEEERREKASKVAMQLLEAMGESDEEEGSAK